MSTAALSVDYTLWNPLAIKVGKKIDQMEVLEEQWPIFTSSLGFVWVWNGGSIGSCVDGISKSTLALCFGYIRRISTYGAGTVASSRYSLGRALRGESEDGIVMCSVLDMLECNGNVRCDRMRVQGNV